MSVLDLIKSRTAERATRDGRKLGPKDFLGGLPDDYPNEPCLIVVPLTVGELDASTEAALKYRKGLLADLGDKARLLVDDPAFFTDAECIEKLWRACRDIENPARPAFESAQWIRDNLTMEEVAVINALQVTVQGSTSPIKTATLEDREALSDAVSHSDGPMLAAMVERFPKSILADLYIFECRSHRVTRESLLALQVETGKLTAAEAYGDFGARVADAIERTAGSD